MVNYLHEGDSKCPPPEQDGRPSSTEILIQDFTKLPSAVVVTQRSVFGNKEVSQLESNAPCGRANLTYLDMGLDQKQKDKH